MQLPAPLARYLDRVGHPSPTASRIVLEQRGTMRLAPGAKWLPFTAEQWCSVSELAFCWHARVKMAPLVTAVVEDAFEDGRGRLDAKIWGAIPVAHGEGPDLDRGEVQRYLAELAWNPGAFTRNAGLHYESRDDGAVRVWHGEPEVYVDLGFDDAGDLVRTYSDTRTYGDEGPRPWTGQFSDYRELGGLRVPTRGEVSWTLADGQFCYWRGEVTELEQVDGHSA